MTATDTILPLFEDETVTNARVKITNAGDGLSDALKISPEALHIGDDAYYLIRGEVTQVAHVTKDDVLTRVHTVKASAATKVDGKVAEKMLAAAADELEKAKAEAAGQLALDEENAAREREAND